MSTYSLSKKLNCGFEEAERRTRDALAEEGFGVLTEIDVQATLRKKLDVSFPRYTILGACNPPFAHEALLAEEEGGLLLPCNVIVYEKDGVVVSAIRPTEAMSMVDNKALDTIAKRVEEKLSRVIERL